MGPNGQSKRQNWRVDSEQDWNRVDRLFVESHPCSSQKRREERQLLHAHLAGLFALLRGQHQQALGKRAGLYRAQPAQRGILSGRERASVAVQTEETLEDLRWGH